MHGKCPRCEKVLSHVILSDIKITAGFRQATEYAGVGPLKGA